MYIHVRVAPWARLQEAKTKFLVSSSWTSMHMKSMQKIVCVECRIPVGKIINYNYLAVCICMRTQDIAIAIYDISRIDYIV